MPLVDNKYAVRRAMLTREQNKMVRDMLNSHMTALSNHVVAMVECGDAKYGRSAMTGYEYARKTVMELNAHREMCRIFPPDDMWEQDGWEQKD